MPGEIPAGTRSIPALAPFGCGEQAGLAADPGFLVADDRLRRQGGRGGLQAGEFSHGGADRHELDEAAELVDMCLDPDHVLRADRRCLVAYEADRVLAGLVD